MGSESMVCKYGFARENEFFKTHSSSSGVYKMEPSKKMLDAKLLNYFCKISNDVGVIIITEIAMD